MLIHERVKLEGKELEAGKKGAKIMFNKEQILVVQRREEERWRAARLIAEGGERINVPGISRITKLDREKQEEHNGQQIFFIATQQPRGPFSVHQED